MSLWWCTTHSGERDPSGAFSTICQDHEATGSGLSRRRSGIPAFLRGVVPPSLWLEDFAHLPMRDHVLSVEETHRHRRYFCVTECECQWREEVGINHHDVSLSTGRHLNLEEVPVPPVTKKGKGLEEEIVGDMPKR